MDVKWIIYDDYVKKAEGNLSKTGDTFFATKFCDSDNMLGCRFRLDKGFFYDDKLEAIKKCVLILTNKKNELYSRIERYDAKINEVKKLINDGA